MALTGIRRRIKRALGPLPNVLIIGAQKCGTTTLWECLRRHPRVCVGLEKETHFFDRVEYYHKGVGWYRSRFFSRKWARLKLTGQKSVVLDATPAYLYDRRVPGRAAELVPNAKLIAITRDPVTRAYSSYWFNRDKWGVESASFEEALRRELSWTEPPEPDSVEDRFYTYLSRGLYNEQLARWREYYDEDRFYVTEMRTLRKEPERVLNELCRFLGIEPAAGMLEQLKRSHNKGAAYPPMSDEARQLCEAFFEKHRQD